MKTKFASIVVALFVSMSLLISCGKGERAMSDKDSLDSLVNDSVPPSGENEYQSDLIPQPQVDSLKDSIDRKP